MWDGGLFWFWRVDITDSMDVCQEVEWACNGDSGGPLIIKCVESASDLQVRVASFVSNSGCADTDNPDVYARVSNAYDWIQSEVCKGSTYASEAGFDCSSSASFLDDDDMIDFVLDVFDGK